MRNSIEDLELSFIKRKSHSYAICIPELSGCKLRMLIPHLLNGDLEVNTNVFVFVQCPIRNTCQKVQLYRCQ